MHSVLGMLCCSLPAGAGPLLGDAVTKAEQTLGSVLPCGTPKFGDLYAATRREFETGNRSWEAVTSLVKNALSPSPSVCSDSRDHCRAVQQMHSTRSFG